jgi:hypothetical protein
MAIEVKLQAEGAPGRHPEITQPKPLIDEVEIIMQAFPTIGFQEGLAGGLVMPGLIRGARFHGRENMDEPGMPPALVENGLEAIFFPELFQFADKLDLKAMLLGDRLRMGPDPISEGISKPGIIEDADAPQVQEGGHPGGITEPWQRALDDDTVETGPHSTNLCRVAVKQ